MRRSADADVVLTFRSALTPADLKVGTTKRAVEPDVQSKILASWRLCVETTNFPEISPRRGVVAVRQQKLRPDSCNTESHQWCPNGP